MTTRRRLLIVEDDASLARVLKDNFVYDGFEVAWAADGHAAISAARTASPDVIILDAMLPDFDGFDLVGLLRRCGQPAVIMLTARSEKADKLRGLNLGADDYVTKPFDLDELMARVRAVLRRATPEAGPLRLGAVLVDFQTMQASRSGAPLRLSRREFELLRYLASHRGQVVLRAELLREVWDYPDEPHTRSVDHAVARLRKKIEPDSRSPRYLHTGHGDGYFLTPD